MQIFKRIIVILLVTILWLMVSAPQAQAAGIVGTGSAASCDESDLAEALMGGGLVTFRCGNAPHTIVSDNYVIQEDTVIRGGNLIILDGDDLHQHFVVDTGATLELHGIELRNGASAQGGCVAVNIGGTLNTLDTTFRSCHNTSSTIGGGAVYNLGTFNATNTTFIQNRSEGDGGAIFNRGVFNGTFVNFEANTAADDSGAIANDTNGQVLILDASFIGNSAAGAGGAIGNTLSFPETDGFFTLTRALFSDNTAGTTGGAVNNVIPVDEQLLRSSSVYSVTTGGAGYDATGGLINEAGSMFIDNSTFYQNIATEGGAFYANGPTNTTILYSTFTGNRATLGGAIYRPLTGFVEIGTSILAESRNKANTANELECDGPPLNSLGYNLIEDNSCVDGNTATDTLGTPPQLGPIQNNGGFTNSRMPNAGSPAVDKIPARLCTARDQRLALRITGACDIGAVERNGLFSSAFLPSVRK